MATVTITLNLELYINVDDTDDAQHEAEQIARAALDTDDRIYLVKNQTPRILLAG